MVFMASASEEHSYTCIYSRCGLVFCNLILCSAVSKKSTKMKPRLTIFTMLTMICFVVRKHWHVITVGEVESKTEYCVEQST